MTLTFKYGNGKFFHEKPPFYQYKSLIKCILVPSQYL